MPGNTWKRGHCNKTISEETRRRLRESRSGRVTKQNTREHLAEAGRNRPWTPEMYEKMSGPNHPNWRGGISFDGYCPIFSRKDFREMIFERDNYKCQNDLCWKKSDTLTIHHIDHDKQHCHPDNCIALCNSCNPRANFNRGFWQKHYMEIINAKRKERDWRLL